MDMFSHQYKALCSNQPIYLKEMPQAPNRVRGLGSSDQNLLIVPRIKTKIGEGSRPDVAEGKVSPERGI